MPGNEAEIAWAAGLFEGEGTFTHNGRGTLRTAVVSCDRDVLERFHEIVGFGKLATWASRQTKPTNKIQHEWYVYGWVAMRDVLETFRPWLGNRRIMRAEDLLGEHLPDRKAA